MSTTFRNRFHKNIDGLKDRTFYISGCLGDIVFSLAAIRAVGGGRLVIGPDLSSVCGVAYAPPRCVSTEHDAWFMKELVETQPYITSCDFSWKRPREAFDLNFFRRFFTTSESWEFNICHKILEGMKLPKSASDIAWLHFPTVVPGRFSSSRILFNRTFRSRNRRFPWNEIMASSGEDRGFVGTDDEYEDFVRKFGWVSRHIAGSGMDLLYFITGCDAVVCNSSFVQALAEAGKRRYVFERAEGHGHSFFEGDHVLKSLPKTEPDDNLSKTDIVHVYSYYPHREEGSRKRYEFAKDSWSSVFTDSYDCQSVAVSKTKRDSREIGDSRGVPFLNELLQIAMERCRDDDSIVILTNDDTILKPGIIERVETLCRAQGACNAFRLSQDSTKRKYKEPFFDFGRDLFAFSRGWLRKHIHNIPDYYIGTTDWDYFLAAYMRHVLGIEVNNQDLHHRHPDVEVEPGFVFHEIHDAYWRSDEALYHNPAQIHNILLTRKHFAKFGWSLCC